MGKRKRETVAPGLLRVKKRFVVWRKNRVRGARIPDHLWEAAARVAGEFGVCQASRVLALDYYALKRRLDEQVQKPATTAFVELTTPTITGVSECSIELEDGAGASMRMHIKGIDSSTLAAVGQSLWATK